MEAQPRGRTATVALVVFGLLVVATVGAFFVAQRLKRSSPVVKRVSLPLYISPNGDHRKDRIRISFFLPKADNVTVSMVNGGGDEIRRLADNRRLHRGVHSFLWTGRDNSGAVPPDGAYHLRVVLRDEGRAATTPRGVKLITARPRPKLVSVTPNRILPRGPRHVTIRFSGPSNPTPLYSVFRTGPGLAKPVLVDRFAGLMGKTEGVWNGRDSRGRLVPPGTYAFAVTVQNRALVSGSAPRRLPPTAQAAGVRTGVTITGPQGAGPLEPVRAGAIAGVALPGHAGHIRYTLVRVGSTRPLRRGNGRGAALRVRIPRGTASGLYVIRARTGNGVASVPVVVRGPARGGGVLVVLPTIAWQGLNPLDDDSDGFPDTLAAGAPAVSLTRPYALGRLPTGFRTESAPLIELLDSSHDRYDVTTDLALARAHGPGLAGHHGVLFAGSELWLTERLDSRLRSYVENGGKVASFGTDAFRRTVQVTPTSLADPSPAQGANIFGEQTAPSASAAAPLVVQTDALGLFGATDGFVGLFTRFEQQQALVGGAQVLTGAGRDPKHPAFVAYKLGKGTVVRTGTPQWATSIPDDAEVAAVTRATWDLLSR